MIYIKESNLTNDDIILQHHIFSEIINQSIADINQDIGKINEKVESAYESRNILLEGIKVFQKDTKQFQELLLKKKDNETKLEDYLLQKKMKKESYSKNEPLLIELDILSMNTERLYRELTNLFSQFSIISQRDVFFENPNHDLITTVNKIADYLTSMANDLKDLEKKKETFNTNLKITSDKLFGTKNNYEKNSHVLNELHEILSYIEKTRDELLALVKSFIDTGLLTFNIDTVLTKESQRSILDYFQLKVKEAKSKLIQYQNEKTRLEDNSKVLYNKNLEFREISSKNIETLKLLQEIVEKFNNKSHLYAQLLYPYADIEALNKEIENSKKNRDALEKNKELYEKILTEGEKKLSECQRIEKNLIDFTIATESFPEKDIDNFYKHIHHGEDLFKSIQSLISEQLPISLIDKCNSIVAKLGQTTASNDNTNKILVINDLEKINSDIEHNITIIPWQSQIKFLENSILVMHQKEADIQKQKVLNTQSSLLKQELEQKNLEYLQIEKDLEVYSNKKEFLNAVPDRSGIAKLSSILLIIFGLLVLFFSHQNIFSIFIGSILGLSGIICLFLLFNPKLLTSNSLETNNNRKLQLVPTLYRYKRINDQNYELIKRKAEINLLINQKNQSIIELEQSSLQLQKELDLIPAFSSKHIVDINNSLQAYQKFIELIKWVNYFNDLIKLYKQKNLYLDNIQNGKSRLIELTESYMALIKETNLVDQSKEISSKSLVESVSEVEVRFKQTVDSLKTIDDNINALCYKKKNVISVSTELNVFQNEVSATFGIILEKLPNKVHDVNQEQEVITKEIDLLEKTRFEESHMLENINNDIVTATNIYQQFKDTETKAVALITNLTAKNDYKSTKYNISIEDLNNKIKSLELEQNHSLQSSEILNTHIKDVQMLVNNLDTEILTYNAKVQQLTNLQMNIRTLVDSIEKIKIESLNKYSFSIETAEDLKLIIQSLRGQQEVSNYEIDLIDQKIDEYTVFLTEIDRNLASLEVKISTEQKKLINTLKSFDLNSELIYADIETIFQAIKDQFTHYEIDKTSSLEKIKQIEFLRNELELIVKHFEIISFIQRRWIEKQEFVEEIESNISVLNARLANISEFSQSLEILSLNMQLKTEDLSKNIIHSIKTDLESYFNALGGHQLLKSLNLEFRYIRNKLNLELKVGMDKIQAGSPKALFSNGEQISLVLALFFALIKQTLPHLQFKWVGLDEPTQYLDYTRKKAFITFICDFAKRFDNIQMLITTADRELINIVEDLHETTIQVASVKQLISNTFSDSSETLSQIDLQPKVLEKPSSTISEKNTYQDLEKELFFPINATKPSKIFSSLDEITKGRTFICKICKNSFLALTYQNTCNNSTCINEYKNNLFL